MKLPLNNPQHKFRLPRVVVEDRFDCNLKPTYVKILKLAKLKIVWFYNNNIKYHTKRLVAVPGISIQIQRKFVFVDKQLSISDRGKETPLRLGGTFSQYHQDFMSSFCTNILLPKITNPKCKHICKSCAKYLCTKKLDVKCW